MFFRMRWIDRRLAYEDETNHTGPLLVPAKYAQRLWDPDIYFPNEKRASFHTVLSQNEIVKIYPNGTVWHSVRSEAKHSLHNNACLIQTVLDTEYLTSQPSIGLQSDDIIIPV